VPRLAIFAAALLVVATPVLAGSGLGRTPYGVILPKNTGSLFDTTFDLGFDVSEINYSASSVKDFVLRLDPDRQYRLIGACGYFLRYPEQAKSPQTRGFCRNLYD
jgi:hypothetical protein